MAAVLAVILGLAVAAVASGPAQAAFHVEAFDAHIVDGAGNPATQAASHPDEITTWMEFGDVAPDPVFGFPIIQQLMRDVVVDLPAGLVGNPQAVSTCDRKLLVPKFTSGIEPMCPLSSQVGLVSLNVGLARAWAPLYQLETPSDAPAAFGFNVNATPVVLTASVRTDGDYGLTLGGRNISEALPVAGISVTMWGSPASPVHDAYRKGSQGDQFIACLDGSATGDTPSSVGSNCHVDGPVLAFLTSPSSCTSPGAGLPFSLSATSWDGGSDALTIATHAAPGFPQTPDQWGAPVGITGCEDVPFTPTTNVVPTTSRAGAPTGLDVDVSVPDDGLLSPDAVAQSNLKKVEMTFPEGMVINPSAANGLEACSPSQVALKSAAAASCPDGAKLGAVTIDTPLLATPLKGSIFLAKQGDNPFGSLLALYLVADGSGVTIKLAGKLAMDAQTGRLTATFDDTPQLPFSNLHLHFAGGPRGPLVTPHSCGAQTVTSQVTSWSGRTVDLTSTFSLSDCAAPQFSPGVTAGSAQTVAGGSSTFVLRVTRSDADNELKTIKTTLPQGLLANVGSVPLCTEAQAAAGACPETSRIGRVTVGTGAGTDPFYITNGKVFLTEGYKGAPFGMLISVPAVAGPLDLGMVNVRAAVRIDLRTTQVTVDADPMPRILQGIPLQIRDLRVIIDRDGFMVNPTSCDPSSVATSVTSQQDETTAATTPFQVSDCAALPVNPAFGIRLVGGRKELATKGHPGVVADLTQTPGQAGLGQVQVPLPAGVSVDLENVAGTCTAADAAARTCPDSAVVGKASVKTPVLAGDLTGPVYLIENKADGKVGLPKLWLKLQGGGVVLDLFAETTITGGRVISTFTNIPDAPISAFHLEINGGAKGILQTARNQCTASRTSKAVFEGQNGKVVRRTVRFGTDCPTRISKTKVSRTAVALTVSGIGAGKLSVSGSGVRKASKTLKSADVATVTAKLSASAKRTLARKGSVRLRLSVVYQPVTGEAVTLRKSVTVRAKKR